MPSSPADAPGAPRLHKHMAAAGIGSRRACENLIAAGRVTVNGATARLGDRAGWADRVEVDGVPLVDAETTVHYLVNKPVGVVSTADDPHGRPTVVGLAPPGSRLYPVGRLDADSEGLIIVTNDGELTHLLTHPSHGVDKEYLVHVEGTPAAGALRRLRDGVELDDGPTAPARVSMPQAGVLSIVIHEGRNRQVRRMCEAVGHPVLRLVRVRIGPLGADPPPPGGCRRLTSEEVRKLYAAAAGRTENPP
ncbi:MAG TPA: MFS transporter [Acidimicrobiaceae bacterium]|nr:MFS transporter [Acidimicrobiaceae bacterium]